MRLLTPALALLFVLASAAPERAFGATVDGTVVEGSPAGVSAQQADRVPIPEASDEAMRYYRSGNVLWFVQTLWGFLVPALILFTGLSARMRDVAKRLGRKWFFIIAVYGVLYLILNQLASLPLSYYAGFARQHAYGLSNQALGQWFRDWAVGGAVGAVAIVLLMWIPYLLLGKAPKRWWLYTSAVAIPIILAVNMIFPVVVAPLFDDFGAMNDKTLEADILAVAARAGIEGGRVYEVNKSEDTEAVNAYVAGFGQTKRIVLWDTIIRKTSHDQILFVMGHEMCHFVLGHVWKGAIFSSVLILVTLFFAHRIAWGLIGRFQDRFRFQDLADVASLPLLLLVANLLSLLIAPAGLWYTRWAEHEADRFGLEMLQDNTSAAEAFVILSEENLGNPKPGLIYKLWRSTHPPIGERVEFMNQYRPWERGEALKYGDLFGPST